MELELAPPMPPAGFELAADALARFLGERVRATNETERDHERTQAELLINKALGSGALVVFVQERGKKPKRILPHLWTAPNHVRSLYRSGASWHHPLVLTEDFYQAEGIALVDRTNFANFSEWAGRWPPFDIPPAVRLMLDVCNDWPEMAKDAPMQKADIIMLLRQHWPQELEAYWPKEQRFAHTHPKNTKDGCSEAASMIG